MRPGVVHSVTTMKDCIAVGGHFFSAPTMKYTIYSIFHTFVGSNSITNVPADDEHQMLLRIILMWHKTICEGSYLDRIEELGQGIYVCLEFIVCPCSCNVIQIRLPTSQTSIVSRTS